MSTTTEAICALQTPGLAYDALVNDSPRQPGLYAFWADPATLAAMAWDVPFEGKPLYDGKSESSLNSRDVTTHFGAGKTGWSTARRSLAVVLRDELHLGSLSTQYHHSWRTELTPSETFLIQARSFHASGGCLGERCVPISKDG